MESTALWHVFDLGRIICWCEILHFFMELLKMNSHIKMQCGAWRAAAKKLRLKARFWIKPYFYPLLTDTSLCPLRPESIAKTRRFRAIEEDTPVMVWTNLFSIKIQTFLPYFKHNKLQNVSGPSCKALPNLSLQIFEKYFLWFRRPIKRYRLIVKIVISLLPQRCKCVF